MLQIYHETKGEESPPIENKSEDDVKLKGNIEIIDETKTNDEVEDETLEKDADDCNTCNVQSSQQLRGTDVTKHANNTTDTKSESCKHQKDTGLNAEVEVQLLEEEDDDALSEIRKDNIYVECDDLSEDVNQIENTYREETECNLSRFKAENLKLTNDIQYNLFSENKNVSAAEKESTELDNASVSSEEKASDICTDPCDFCEKIARFVCRNCNYCYCKKCLDIVHPTLGPYKSHKIIPVDGIVVQHHERCKEHGLDAQLHCSYCEQKRCVECANTICFLHFKGRVSEEDIEREKNILVEELEKATLKMGFLGRYKDMVEGELENVEITGLLRKEQIRQEFVSFHDLLVEKEAEMLEQLELDVQERQEHLKNTLEASVSRLEQDDAELTTTVTELVQSENDALFIEECVKAKDRCAMITDKVRDFDLAWAKNSSYTCRPLLDYQFSMILDKRQLLNRLDATVEKERQIQFKQKTLFLNYASGPLRISDYLHIPVVPTSTEVCYTIQLFASGKLVYVKETKDILDFTINTKTSVQLGTGQRYLVKIHPSYKCFVSDSKKYVKYGNPTHMFIVVDYMFHAEKLKKNYDKSLNFDEHKTAIHRKHAKDQSQKRLQTYHCEWKKRLVVTDRKKEAWLHRTTSTSKACDETELKRKEKKENTKQDSSTINQNKQKGKALEKKKKREKQRKECQNE